MCHSYIVKKDYIFSVIRERICKKTLERGNPFTSRDIVYISGHLNFAYRSTVAVGWLTLQTEKPQNSP